MEQRLRGYARLISSFYYDDANAPRPNRPRRVGVVALIEHDGRLLFERRADAPVWGLIAGGVNDDETLDAALRREVREETGLAIRQYEFFGTFSEPSRIAHYPDGTIVQILALAYRVEAEDVSLCRISEESLELRFFAREHLPMEDLVPTQRAMIARYLSNEPPPFLD